VIYRLERFFYYLLLITIPIQLGRHFWPHFSFVHGIRVDYLSPTIYLSDIAVVSLLALYILRKKGKLLIVANKVFLAGLLTLSAGLFFAYSREAVLFGIIKYVEFVCLGYYIAQETKRQDIGKTLFALSLGAGVQFILLLFQLLSQHSVGGAFYYLGERTFSRTTPGIALFSFQNTLWLRPYGSFPHPNVMGFYFFTVFFLLIGNYYSQKEKLSQLVLLLAMAMFALGVLLSFSRILIVLLFLLLPILLIWNNKKRIREIVIALFPLALIVVTLLFSRLTQTIWRDFSYRIDLMQIAVTLFLTSPFLGVGINNFYYHEILFQKSITPTLLQPVHNIYLLILAQNGLVGSVVVGVFIKNLVYALKQRLEAPFYKAVGILVLGGLIVGLFDHFLLTLQQGQLLLTVILGLSFSKIKELG